MKETHTPGGVDVYFSLRDPADYAKGMKRVAELIDAPRWPTKAGIQYLPRTETTRIILHDSHTPPSMDRGVDYLLVHGRHRGLLTIGYHFVIERNGEATECRPFDRVGSHCPGRNHNSVGVCLVGGRSEASGGEEDNFTGEQLLGLRKLVKALHTFYPGVPVLGHSEVVRGEHCPCPCVDMKEIRAGLHQEEVGT